jgi:hypothetical protein
MFDPLPALAGVCGTNLLVEGMRTARFPPLDERRRAEAIPVVLPLRKVEPVRAASIS